MPQFTRYTVCFKKSFTTLKTCVNLFRGYVRVLNCRIQFWTMSHEKFSFLLLPKRHIGLVRLRIRLMMAVFVAGEGENFAVRQAGFMVSEVSI
jgi:hypothetical protein